MGIITKSHGRKSDKETQSPMLKIFKDIMQKDNIEPEKVTLLKDKKKEKKKKSYSESRSKSDQRSYDSSSTDRYKTNKQANITVQDILEDREDYRYDRSRSDAFGGDKKESWWFWKDFKKKQDEKREPNKTDDTCSCVSCALKKIIGSECTCVTLLVVLFSVSVVIAFLLIFHTDPTCDTRQQIKRQLPEEYGTERIKWDRQLNSLDGVSDILENSGNSFKGPNIPDPRPGLRFEDRQHSLETSDDTEESRAKKRVEKSRYFYPDDMNAELSGDLATILDTQKMDSQTSEKLRDFFKKLVQTDVKIKKLKQDVNNYYQNDNLKSFADRFKRSLKSHFSNQHSRTFNAKKRIPKYLKRNAIKDKRRLLRNHYNITGYIIEQEKVLFQYEPGRKRNFPKCSHSHETKSHEKKLKHPFYKHSQRIDEMLKYKKPEMGKTLIQTDVKEKPSMPTTTQMKLIDYKVVYDENDIVNANTDVNINVKTDRQTGFDIEKYLSTTPVYDVSLSVSSFINPLDDRSNFKTSHVSTNDRIGYRKLMEADEEDDEEVNYEDLKEVLTDDQQEHDDLDRPLEKKKRCSEEQFDLNHYKYSPSQILNPNWKGPMPFYPDELNAMIKQAAIQNFNIKQPVQTKDFKSNREVIKKDVSDTEYIEDYSDKKFNKIVEMAQAYSDYGVVYNKKDEDSKNKMNNPENRYKQSLVKGFYKNDFGRTTKETKSEGIRFEYRPGTVKNEHEELIKDITKHIKVIKNPLHNYHSTTLKPINMDMYNMLSSSHYNVPSNHLESSKSTKANKNLIFALRKGSRSLKSLDITYKAQRNSGIGNFNQTNIHNTTDFDSLFSFLAIMGDWFRTLSNLSGESNGLNENTKLQNITRLNSTKSKNKRLEANNSSEVVYPSYDLEMVDNIGHRSRVLMSVSENNTDEKSDRKVERRTDTKIHNTESSNQSDSDNILPIALILAASSPNKSEDKGTSSKENMTSIVKRSIGDNKLVFWNGLYDDNEYGIKLDYADNISDKHFIKGRNAMQKSKDWIQGKFNNITQKVKGKLKQKPKSTTKKIIVKCDKIKPKSKIKPSVPKNRKIRNSNENPDLSMKKTFATLTANLKNVCQQAAKAVQNTKNIKVRDDSKEGVAAASLMQQLVRLMSDLVDIQVQQKTCAKLPLDLQNFLEWLTAPSTESSFQVDDLSAALPDYVAVDGFARIDKSTKSDFLSTLSEDSHQEYRTECLGTIKAVQDLILQYEGMNDDDKSKMSGVKEYLENQLNFLNRKLNRDVNLYQFYDKSEVPRIKRDSNAKPNKFIKNFSKRHTKISPNSYITETREDTFTLNNKFDKNIYTLNNNIGKIINEKVAKDDIKRP